MNGAESMDTRATQPSISPIFLGNEPAHEHDEHDEHHENAGDERGSSNGLAADDLSPQPSAAPPAPMRAHLTIDLDEDFYDRKLSIEDATQRPCIVPGNALHLIDDDPSPRSQTPSSIIIVADMPRPTSPEGAVNRADDRTRSSSSEPPPPPPARPVPRVRFRSRVRITSGVHKHRHGAGARGTGMGTPPSSASDSPSSSISAPLRYQADENGTWGPLGKRLSAYAGAGWQRPPRHKQDRDQDRARRPNGASRADERTPLVHGSRRTAYVDPNEDLQEGDEDEDEEERAMRAAALRREHDAVFGKWPWRLFNRHWWWWQVEPVLCCCCPDDSDYEE